MLSTEKAVDIILNRLSSIDSSLAGQFCGYLEKRMVHEDVMKELVSIFTENCGISIGFRTIGWDLAWSYLSRYLSTETDPFPDMYEYCEKNVDAWDDFKKFDIAPMAASEFLDIAIQYYMDNPEKRAALAKGLVCHMQNCDEKDFANIDEDENT